MILILSIDGDYSTDIITDWLENLKASFIRIHFDELINGISKINIAEEIEFIELKDRTIKIQEINVVWYRKWQRRIPIYDSLGKENDAAVTDAIRNEYNYLNDFILNLLKFRTII